MSEANHAKMSPSGAHRWMRCPASLLLEQTLPDTSSKYADEGTRAELDGEPGDGGDADSDEEAGKEFELGGFHEAAVV